MRIWLLCSVFFFSMAAHTNEADAHLSVLSEQRIAERSEQLHSTYLRTYYTRTAIRTFVVLGMLNTVVHGIAGTFTIQARLAEGFAQLAQAQAASESKSGWLYAMASNSVGAVTWYLRDSLIRSLALVMTAILSKPLEPLLKTESTMRVKDAWFVTEQVTDAAVQAVVVSNELHQFVQVLKAIDLLLSQMIAQQEAPDECVIRMIELTEDLIAHMYHHLHIDDESAFVRYYLPLMVRRIDGALQTWKATVVTSLPEATATLQAALHKTLRMLMTVPFYQVRPIASVGSFEDTTKQYFVRLFLEKNSPVA